MMNTEMINEKIKYDLAEYFDCCSKLLSPLLKISTFDDSDT